MERRKFLVGVGSLAAGSAAAMGTGAFSSVEANRSMNVQVAGDTNALLKLDAEDTPNGNEYVSDTSAADSTISFDFQTDGNGDGTSSDGINDNAKTLVRNLFSITNQGSQGVYVWPSNLPPGMKMYVDDTDGGFTNYGTGPGQNQGAFSGSSNLDLNDIDDDQGTGQEEAAPFLTPGETVENISMQFDAGFESYDATITINARSQAEVDLREGE